VLLGQGKAITGPDGKDAPSPQEECPDANPAWEGVGTGDLETDLFEVGTDRFIVSYEILGLQPGSGLLTLDAAVEDENGRSISSGKISSPQPDDPVRIDLTPNTGRHHCGRRAGQLHSRGEPEQGGPEVRRPGGGVRGARGSVGYRPSPSVTDTVTAVTLDEDSSRRN
jgi:hypothetical protein